MSPGRSETAAEERRFRTLEDFEGSLANRADLSLRDAILNLACRPGEALRKAEIRDAPGVSRSPASEAVARLSAEGLVEVVPQSGTFVARFSMQDMRECAFLREAIELAAVEFLASRINGEISGCWRRMWKTATMRASMPRTPRCTG